MDNSVSLNQLSPRTPLSVLEDMVDFCLGDTNRPEWIMRRLESWNLSYELIQKGKLTHIQLRFPTNEKDIHRKKILVAHHDRVPGSPGANDNGAAVFHLLSLAQALKDGQVKDQCGELIILFSDGEELERGIPATGQGIHQLALEKGQELFQGRLILVLDMCGIGDTLIISKGLEEELKKQGNSSLSLMKELKVQRLHTLRVLSKASFPHREVVTPYSDDLGLLLAGYPSSLISLLDHRDLRPGSLRIRNPSYPTWKTMHSPQDSPEHLTPGAFALFQDFLRHWVCQPAPRKS